MNIGYIGTGNMGGAMVRGMVGSGLVLPKDCYIYNRNAQTTQVLVRDLGVQPTKSLAELVTASNIIILAIKPEGYAEMLAQLKPLLGQKVLVSIAAGVDLAQMSAQLGRDKKIIRVMPNTPASVGAGVSAFMPNGQITEEECADVIQLLTSFGHVEKIPESQIHAFIGAAGSLPAVVDLMVEALADGAVYCGMPRDQAYRTIIKSMKGSLALLEKSVAHPGQLKDEVCSPGGATIEMIATAERGNLRATLMDTLISGAEKSKKMSEK
ncbi:pyrroline-5-carboxylate reductase [Erysipelotrichaceae bacterium]|nr:pyrroline-5-carboxylate reductase [Erysipelotrichaceae bacterium]